MDRGCLAVCLLIFVIAAAVHTAKRTYPDTARFSGDTWEYQSVGVNIALGHGQRFGGAEPFEVYRFEPMSPEPLYKASFMRRGTLRDSFHYYRTPGYPYFLALIYRIVGVHPAAVKRVQALSLILVGAFLPFLGLRLWGLPGFLGGLAAVPAFLLGRMHLAGEILTESLIVLTLFVMVLVHLRWSRTRSRASLFLLGLSVGWGLLVKGSLIFFPPIYLGYLLWSGRRDAWRQRAAGALVFLGGVGVVVLPYSVFASIKAGQVVVLSAQGAVTLLDGNNEIAVRTGTWQPEWQQVPESFFKRADIAPRSPVDKVLRFYRENPGSLLRILPRKIDRAFESSVSLRFLCWGLIAASVLALTAGMPIFANRVPLVVGVATGRGDQARLARRERAPAPHGAGVPAGLAPPAAPSPPAPRPAAHLFRQLPAGDGGDLRTPAIHAGHGFPRHPGRGLGDRVVWDRGIAASRDRDRGDGGIMGGQRTTRRAAAPTLDQAMRRRLDASRHGA